MCGWARGRPEQNPRLRGTRSQCSVGGRGGDGAACLLREVRELQRAEAGEPLEHPLHERMGMRLPLRCEPQHLQAPHPRAIRPRVELAHMPWRSMYHQRLVPQIVDIAGDVGVESLEARQHARGMEDPQCRGGAREGGDVGEAGGVRLEIVDGVQAHAPVGTQLDVREAARLAEVVENRVDRVGTEDAERGQCAAREGEEADQEAGVHFEVLDGDAPYA